MQWMHGLEFRPTLRLDFRRWWDSSLSFPFPVRDVCPSMIKVKASVKWIGEGKSGSRSPHFIPQSHRLYIFSRSPPLLLVWTRLLDHTANEARQFLIEGWVLEGIRISCVYNDCYAQGWIRTIPDNSLKICVALLFFRDDSKRPWWPSEWLRNISNSFIHCDFVK